VLIFIKKLKRLRGHKINDSPAIALITATVAGNCAIGFPVAAFTSGVRGLVGSVHAEFTRREIWFRSLHIITIRCKIRITNNLRGLDSDSKSIKTVVETLIKAIT
jgi:hypothetical protein